ncbi:23S rRNA (uracil(1939)-C(5))-methyltransferase RlmD [Thermocrinis minervae]|uniref:23S rRNA (Uracil-5-)-methyltransferase RumA n=1 Tax=Thermocrinis minervae TaxID=381751 RepID=A0A1M6SHU8_9AQUI|nr:23S rRNA (uracil(1939)-C(5))-methyltransferase RlmD [Thermocrinis minervae]SHK44187.1 23S rRNA (uracil-5-)-methyltransferase RumA [Thermocrinis minervae]
MRLELEVFGIDSKARPYSYVDGKRVYLSDGIPGDLVRVELKRFKSEPFGIVKEIIRLSSSRIEPRCKHFGECGGCRFQHVDYGEQLRIKKSIVEDALRLNGLDVQVEDTIPSPRVWFYRNRMDYVVSPGPKVGLRKLGRWDYTVDLQECYLMSEEVVKIIDIVRKFLLESGVEPYDNVKREGFFRYVVIREGKFTGERLISLVTRSGSFAVLEKLVEELKHLSTSIVWSINDSVADVSVGTKVQSVYGKDHLTENIEGITFYVHPNAFFQTNSFQAVNMVKLAKEHASGGHTLVDLYAGVGLFTYHLMDKYSRVISVEIDPNAVLSSKRIKEELKADHVTVLQESAEERLSKIKVPIDTLVVDPPRAGLSKKVKDAILRADVGQILYFSCNPSTFASDVAYLSRKFKLLKVQPLDMFPHTPHVEVFGLLTSL